MPPRLTKGGFAQQIRNYAKTLPKNVDDYVKTLASRTQEALIHYTPIYSGRAKNNWQVGVGSIPKFYRFEKPTHPPRNKYVDDIEFTIQANDETIASYAGKGKIYIMNNAPYIGRLNANPPWSDQAPANYIESVIENVREQLRPRKGGLSRQVTGIPEARVGKITRRQTIKALSLSQAPKRRRK